MFGTNIVHKKMYICHRLPGGVYRGEQSVTEAFLVVPRSIRGYVSRYLRGVSRESQQVSEGCPGALRVVSGGLQGGLTWFQRVLDGVPES